MTDRFDSVGIVGCGAMGGALAAGLVAGHPGLAERLVLADVVPASLRAAIDDTGGREGTVADVASCDLVVVAVKPTDLGAALRSLSPGLRDTAVLASVAAGRSLDDLEAAGARATARLMPNLAVRHGAGLIALATRGLDGAAEDSLRQFLGVLGTVIELPERLFDAATALAGSGPGILALVAEALEEGGVAAGLSRADARAMVQAVIAGTASLLEGGVDPAALRHRVSSPGGTTVAAIETLERGAVRVRLAEAVMSATARSGEL